jgi:hypothetical protein
LAFEYRLIDWPVKKLAFAADGKVLLVAADEGLRIYDGRPDHSSAGRSTTQKQ